MLEIPGGELQFAVPTQPNRRYWSRHRTSRYILKLYVPEAAGQFVVAVNTMRERVAGVQLSNASPAVHDEVLRQMLGEERQPLHARE
jgi:hypothetical protein